MFQLATILKNGGQIKLFLAKYFYTQIEMKSPIQHFCKINHLRDFNGGTVQIVTLYVYGVRMKSFSLIAILQQE